MDVNSPYRRRELGRESIIKVATLTHDSAAARDGTMWKRGGWEAGNGPVDSQGLNRVLTGYGCPCITFIALAGKEIFYGQSDDIFTSVCTRNKIHSNISRTNGSRTSKIRDTRIGYWFNKVYTKQWYLHIHKASAWCFSSWDSDRSKWNDEESSPKYVRHVCGSA
jgi:hypothetical protein